MNYEQFIHKNKKIFLVDMRKETSKIFSDIAHKWLQKYIQSWKKIMIIVNKKWYSSWIICQDCWFVPKCERCDISIAYHLDENWNYFWLCHICKKHYNQIWCCPNCWGFDIQPYGVWTQKIQQIIKQSFNKNSIIIESETVNSEKKIQQINQEIKDNQIIIWTSLLNQPPQNIIFDLVIFINADIGLNVPDFNSNQRNYLFLYETFLKHKCNNFIVQSFNPSTHSIANACKLDLEWFKKIELNYRKQFNYPPYSQLCVILYKNEIEEKLFTKVNTLYQELLFLKEKMGIKDLEIFSTPPLIYKIFWKYRYNIILKSNELRPFMDEAFSTLKITDRGFKIDWEPQNIV